MGIFGNIPFLCLVKLYCCLAVCWGSISICTISNIWLNLGRQYSPEHVRIHPPTSIINNIINQHQWSSSISSHKCPCYNTASTMSDRWYGILRIMSCSSPSPHFSLSVIFVFQSWSRTGQSSADVFWQGPIWPPCSSVLPVVGTLS